jgi:hypothetical protein
MRYIYTIKTTTGYRWQGEANDAQDAIRRSGFDPSTIRRWYPLCIKVLPTEEEIAERNKRFEMLRQRKAEIKTVCGNRRTETMTIKKDGSIDADFIKKQLTIAETPARTIPDKALRSNRKQDDSPLELEMPAIDAQQGKLF